MSVQQHQSSAQAIVASAAVITLSDSRTTQTDLSGQCIHNLLSAQGHRILHYQIIPNEPAMLDRLLSDLLARNDIDVVLITGGTGLSRRDQTIDVVEKHLTRPLPGFGELFRLLSFQQIGSAAMISRAAGGTAGNKLLFAMPGSPQAVQLALERLILPELKHLLFELRK